jgi:hypothetical protein
VEAGKTTAVAESVMITRVPPINWGVLPVNRAFITLDTKDLYRAENKYRLMLVCRAIDRRIDEKDDADIEKSKIFNIQPSETTLELSLSQKFMKEFIPEGDLQLMVLLIQTNHDYSNIASVQQAIDSGAQLIANPAVHVGAHMQKKCWQNITMLLLV